MTTINDLLIAISAKDSVAAEQALNSVLSTKMADAVNSMKESIADDVFSLQELSSDTVKSYISKASGIENHKGSVPNLRKSALDSWHKYMSSSNGNVRRDNAKQFEKTQDKAENRAKNVGKAAMKLAKEEVEQEVSE
jgi:hypothetical protein